MMLNLENYSSYSVSGVVILSCDKIITVVILSWYSYSVTLHRPLTVL